MVDPAATLVTTPGGTVVLGSGNTLTDSATLSGGSDPTGTITFTLYAPNGTTVVNTQTAPVNGDGTYTTPSGYTPTAPGTYQWVASYSGDASNNSIPNTTQDNEPEIVSLAIPTLTTTPGGTVVLGSGAKLTDSATLAGGYNPTGIITFTLYAPDGSVVDTETDTVSGNNTYATPTGYVPRAAGSYQWVVNYGGDANNNPVPNTALGSESEMVNPAVTTLTTTPGATVVLGSGNPLTDSATLSGGSSPTGTITFTLYAPNGTTVVDTETVPVNGDAIYATPSGYTPTAAGTYHWVASYSGDANNSSVSNTTPCNEPEIVSPASPSLSTTPGGTIVLKSGAKLTDSATLAGGYNPTGTLTFTLDGPTGAAVDTETVTVSGDGTYSTPNGYTPTAAGTYQWVVSYGGDANNNPTASLAGSEPEQVQKNQQGKGKGNGTETGTDTATERTKAPNTRPVRSPFLPRLRSPTRVSRRRTRSSANQPPRMKRRRMASTGATTKRVKEV